MDKNIVALSNFRISFSCSNKRRLKYFLKIKLWLHLRKMKFSWFRRYTSMWVYPYIYISVRRTSQISAFSWHFLPDYSTSFLWHCIGLDTKFKANIKLQQKKTSVTIFGSILTWIKMKIHCSQINQCLSLFDWRQDFLM